MRKNTNIEEIRDFTKLLLNFPIDPIDNIPPEIHIVHPIYESSIQMIDGKLTNIFGDKEAQKKNKEIYSKKLDGYNKTSKFLMMITKPYRLFWVNYCKKYMNLEDFSKSLISAWIQSESPNSDVNVKKYQSICMFQKADKSIIMDEESFDLYQKLPEIIHIYRGVSENLKNKDGLSWTLDLEQAKWFATRFDNGTVYEGDINKEYIFAYLNNAEQEIICNYKKIENMKIYE